MTMPTFKYHWARLGGNPDAFTIVEVSSNGEVYSIGDECSTPLSMWTIMDEIPIPQELKGPQV